MTVFAPALDCGYHRAGLCHSCTRIDDAYDAQLARKQLGAEAAAPGAAWLAPHASAISAFRNKAKMVAGGTVDAPTLGILDGERRGIDLRACPLHEQPIRDALPHLAALVTDARIPPYDVPERRGELKHVLVTASPDAELMVRFVLRSTEAVPRIAKRMDALRERIPGLVVASASILPEHKAVVEGDVEVPLTDRQSLTMRLNDVPLRLRPGGFFQTNSAVAAALYREAATWIDEVDPASVADLYCGVGGFALHAARPHRDVVGVETSAEAIAGAIETASAMGSSARFAVGDATAADDRTVDAALVVVNPPRRGIGALAARLEASAARHVVYSSCNPATLARDLAAMPSLRPVRARMFDMFPHNDHAEVLVLLERR
ncbi:methyltransferase domain-containing protein [Agrococcus sp. SGAir0287]|uniref:methyltransferase domain-containing protein n=1 Tax=Agrococcus sp. SGAir0287 TaxID=2070347 RepID=UPI0010CD6AED|nr:methyltransferase domain-containing protein [Agrococcus sp. SGAir0287]QCR18694.1 23S rRNA (uracil(747)-C(5))-methyltransferase [Agrococcus sp. SGAir0287]